VHLHDATKWIHRKAKQHLICKFKRFIYGLKQASRFWNIHFDKAIKSDSFDQCPNEPYMYKKCNESVVVFLLLYVDGILLIGNDVGILSSVKV